MSSLGKLRDANALEAFVDSVTIRTVRKEIRRRRHRRVVFSRSEVPRLEEVRDHATPLKEAHIRSVYAILEEMPSDDRIIFVLRHLEGHSLGEIARLGKYSLSTAKRRLKAATVEFKRRALKDPVLAVTGKGASARRQLVITHGTGKKKTVTMGKKLKKPCGRSTRRRGGWHGVQCKFDPTDLNKKGKVGRRNARAKQKDMRRQNKGPGSRGGSAR